MPKQELYQAWLRTLRCPDCSKQWYICTFCPRVRTHILDQTRLRLHWRTSHSERPRRARTAKTLASDPPATNNGFGVGPDTNEPVDLGNNTKFGDDTTTNEQEPVVQTVGWSDDDGDDNGALQKKTVKCKRTLSSSSSSQVSLSMPDDASKTRVTINVQKRLERNNRRNV